MAKQEIIFVDGMKIKQRFDGLFGVSINLEYFNKFAEAHKTNGYLNIDICRSKEKNSWYPRLNTWKPTKKNEEPEPITEELIGEDELPF